MIVRDLIDLLFTYPSKAEVRIYDGSTGLRTSSLVPFLS